MKTLAKIKEDLEFNKGLTALVETLKTIAVAQYRSLEKRIKLFEEFTPAVNGFFEHIDVERVDHPFLRPKKESQIAIAITSDSGFLGALNVQVVDAALAELEKISGKLVVIGERGKIYVRGTGMPAAYFPGINDENRYEQARQLRDYIIEKVLSDGFGYVKVIYPKPISFTVQRVEAVTLLPYSSDAGGFKQNFMADTIMESSPDKAIEYLVYLLLGHKFYEIFGLSRLAEFAARYIHLEESAQKIKDRDKKTQLEYFRVRHELVDRTMRELFAGRAIYAK
ncbi:MAG: F0F1 ATP synthase subunit gamma [Omnitrophica bacterium]|nr:F0F1 ATP synthase subunit gamma [Candidatus Omnitrophota bacterium]